MSSRRNRRFALVPLIILICGALLGLITSSASASLIIHDQPLLAVQKVKLLGIDATLVAPGSARFTFDVDANNNTILGGSSTMDALFFGSLPSEFSPLGVAGAPFELFSIDPEVVTASGNGTHVKVETTFGLRVFVAPNVVGANFFTSVPSLFETDVISLTNFSGAVFQDPNHPNDFTEIFVGDNLLGLPPGMLVGVSFDRTVAAVPEPSSFAIVLISGLSGLMFRKRRLPR